MRPALADAMRIEVVGEQWWWRVAYRGRDGSRSRAPTRSAFRSARRSSSRCKSADVIHSFWVPSLGGKVDMIPGRTTHLRLRADRPGVYRGQCAEYCGGPHALMAFEVVAMPADGVRRLARSAGARPPRQPASDVGTAGTGAVPRGRLRRLPRGPRHRGRRTIGPTSRTSARAARSASTRCRSTQAESRALHRRRPARQAGQPHAAVPHLLAERSSTRSPPIS